jgi:hypothetical protein
MQSDLTSTLLTILKFVSIALSGTFGILGLLTKYRDENEKITRWGRIALIGILVTTFVAAVSQGLEARRSQESAKAETQKTQRLLHEISRTLQPLENLSVSLGISVSLENQDIRPYVERVQSKLEEMAVKHNQEEIWRVDNVSGRSDTPGQFHIFAHSSLLPSLSERESVAAQILNKTDFFVGFYKSPIDVNKWEKEFAVENFSYTLPRSAFFTEPDMSFGILLNINSGDLYLKYDKINNRIVQRANNKSLSFVEQPTGKILSFVDLPGSDVVIIMRRRLANDESFQCLQITLPKRQTVKIEGSKMKRMDGYNLGNPATYFFYTFPNDGNLIAGECFNLID